MPTNDFVCPLCRYKAPLALFENMGEGQMRCRRCRSKFPDPNAYSAGVAYADCDSRRAVTRFPFSMNGSAGAVIRVRDGYMALISSGGQRRWVNEPNCRLPALSGASRVD